MFLWRIIQFEIQQHTESLRNKCPNENLLGQPFLILREKVQSGTSGSQRGTFSLAHSGGHSFSSWIQMFPQPLLALRP